MRKLPASTNPYPKDSARHKLWARREADRRKKPKAKPKAKQPIGPIGKVKKVLSGREAQLRKQMKELGI